jgi:hypothetical protein
MALVFAFCGTFGYKVMTGYAPGIVSLLLYFLLPSFILGGFGEGRGRARLR